MKGLSITLCFGKYGGFWAAITSYQWRVCLGWVALTVYPRTDIEELLKQWSDARKTEKRATSPLKESST